MVNVLESTNTLGGIGMNTETHAAQRTAWDKGYREALLDIYVFLTGSPQVFDLDTDHLTLIESMVAQVNVKGGRLLDVTDSNL